MSSVSQILGVKQWQPCCAVRQSIGQPNFCWPTVTTTLLSSNLSFSQITGVQQWQRCCCQVIYQWIKSLVSNNVHKVAFRQSTSESNLWGPIVTTTLPSCQAYWSAKSLLINSDHNIAVSQSTSEPNSWHPTVTTMLLSAILPVSQILGVQQWPQHFCQTI